MAKNHMGAVAALLDVKLNEEFMVKISAPNKMMPYIYKISNSGLNYRFMNDSYFAVDTGGLSTLLTGEAEIIKLPWKPKDGERYYHVSWLKTCNKWMIYAERTQYLVQCDTDNLRVDTGNCFRTKEEAEAAKFDIFERLTGKKWDEVHGKAGEEK